MIVQGLVYNYSLNFLLRALIYLFRITSITCLVLLYEYLLYRRTIITQMMFITIVFILEIRLWDKQTLYIEIDLRYRFLKIHHQLSCFTEFVRILTTFHLSIMGQNNLLEVFAEQMVRVCSQSACQCSITLALLKTAASHTPQLRIGHPSHIVTSIF